MAGKQNFSELWEEVKRLYQRHPFAEVEIEGHVVCCDTVLDAKNHKQFGLHSSERNWFREQTGRPPLGWYSITRIRQKYCGTRETIRSLLTQYREDLIGEKRQRLQESTDEKGFITISTESSVDAFDFDAAETCTKGYYPTEVLWEFLPSLDVESKRDYLKELQAIIKSDEWPQGWRLDVPELWHKIAKYECLENYLYQVEQRGFHIDKLGDKTLLVFESILERHSVSHTFYLTWIGVKNALDYITCERIPNWKAKNLFIGSIQRAAEKAKIDNWELKDSWRTCPQTTVSSTFFNLFLGLGDKAFKEPLPKIDDEAALAS